MVIEYKNKNQYGCTVLSVVIDTDNKTAVLYHGQTAPIGGDWKKASKKFIREIFAAYAENPFYTVKEV